MSTSGHKRKNEDKTESTPKRRRYTSPPPAATPSSSSNPQIIYILKRNLSDKERNNELLLSTTIPMKFALTKRKVVNFGRDPSPNKNQLYLHSTRKLRIRNKEVANDIMISREHGKFIYNSSSCKWFIVDKQSTNGIIVNKTKITPNKQHPLNIDDEIVIGKNVENTEFKYIFTTKTCTKSTPEAPLTPHTINRSHAAAASPLKQTPRLDSQQSQSSQSSFDATQLKNMMEAITKNALAEQHKQFEKALKDKEDETEALRAQIQQQQLAEIAAKEAENKKKQEELTAKALELQQKQEDVTRTQKEQQKEMELEKKKIAKEIEQQKAKLTQQQEIETKKSREREAAAKTKLDELKKQRQDIDARDKKQRERNDIEHKKWLEKQEKLQQEKKKIEDREREIKEKEAVAMKEMEQTQLNMEEECTCCICMCLLVASRSLICGHTSCHQCLEEWMAEQKTCPSCRTAIEREPVPCITVDNLILDTYLKYKAEEERNEYMQRKRDYEEWKKLKKRKDEEEEARRAATAAAAVAAAALERRNVMNNNNSNWRGYAQNNQRHQRHGAGNHPNWLNLNNNIVRSVDGNNRNNNHVVPPFGGMRIPMQPQPPQAHIVPLQMIVNNANNGNNAGVNQNIMPFQQVLRGNNVQHRNAQRRNNNNNAFHRRR